MHTYLVHSSEPLSPSPISPVLVKKQLLFSSPHVTTSEHLEVSLSVVEGRGSAPHLATSRSWASGHSFFWAKEIENFSLRSIAWLQPTVVLHNPISPVGRLSHHSSPHITAPTLLPGLGAHGANWTKILCSEHQPLPKNFQRSFPWFLTFHAAPERLWLLNTGMKASS